MYNLKNDFDGGTVSSGHGSLVGSVMLLGMQAIPILILASGTFFREGLVMKMFLGLLILSLIQEERSTCQLMAKESMPSTGKLPLGGLHRNSVARINDLPDMTSAVYSG